MISSLRSAVQQALPFAPRSWRSFADCIIVLAIAAGSPASLAAEDRKVDAESLELFRTEALPVLRENCFDCHGGGKKVRANFRLTTRAGLVRGGDRGPAIDLKDPSKSLILAMISYRDDEHRMPPSGKLSERDAAVLRRWVELGAPYDPAAEIQADVETSPEELDPTAVSERTRDYWAFRPLAHPTPPGGDGEHPIDAFIQSRLAGAGLELGKPASRRELIRRAYHDLTGLPPAIEDVRAFENDESPNAFEKIIDRLLDSPHYGERWGRHWLDLVRYAESNGYERDSEKPMAYGYRDWVIRSFNEDKPYDRFLIEQLAGDELDDADASSIAGTGYYRLGLWDDEPADPALARYDYLDSIAATTGEAMLGLTIGCSRCHDHKIDPIPQRDYYRFLAFFVNVSPHGGGNANLVEASSLEDERKESEERARKAAREAELHAKIWEIEQAFLDSARCQRPEIAGKVSAPADIVELGYRFYRDTWDSVPDFDQLRAETEGTIADGRITLAPALRRDAMGLVFEGKLRVPVDGEFTFRVASDDGSRLLVSGQIVGEHRTCGEGSFEKCVRLEAGYTPLRFEYFCRSGEPRLDVAWKGPGFDWRPLSAAGESPGVLIADARHGEPVEWQYTFRDPGSRWLEPDFQARRWRRGPGGFGTDGTPGAIVRTEWSSSDIWMRRRFEVRGELKNLTLSIHHDEDVRVWINGQLVHAQAGHRIDYTTVRLDEATKHLREGENIIAVHCRHTIGGQYIDVGLVEEGAPSGISELIAEHGAELLGSKRREAYFDLALQLSASRRAPLASAKRKILAVAEQGRRKTHVLLRGNPSLVGDEVDPGFPSVLSPPSPEISDRGMSSGRRMALARWIASEKNPLTARVAANRVWQHHFGRGIVRSSSNFGRMGEQPTHPELLDWLAGELIHFGWRLKPLHKRIMLSRAYQQSSRSRPEAIAKDPQNDLFWRFDLRRLSAEEIRDAMLAAAGRLNLKLYGPSIYSELPPEVLATSSTGAEKWGTSPPEERYRRSVYIFVRRSLLDPMLTAFDFADTDASCAVRFSTTVPTQALTMLNSKFVNEEAEALARRIARMHSDPRDRVSCGIELALGRVAAPSEVDAGVQMLGELEHDLGLEPNAALARYALLLLNSNEFVFLD